MDYSKTLKLLHPDDKKLAMEIDNPGYEKINIPEITYRLKEKNENV